MKNFIKILTLLIGFMAVSCEEYLDVNTDPNNPVYVTPDLVLPVAQAYTADLMGQFRGVNHLGGMMMFNYGESFGFSWYEEEFKYLVTSEFYDKIFDESFYLSLKQYADLDDLGEDYKAYRAISKIMKAYHFQILVDVYGDVPYTEALQKGGNTTPKYDDAQEIYVGLLQELSEAQTLINEALVSETEILPTEGADAIFGADLTKWKQFANTIKLRIIVRAQNTLDYTSELAKIDAEGSGYITDNVTVNPGYIEGEETKQNPQWEEMYKSAAGTTQMNYNATCATQYVLDYLTITADPRLDFIYEKPETGHLGINQGDENDDASQSEVYVSNIGPGIMKSADMGQVIFTLAEQYLNQAEAVLLGYSGDAKFLYESGITASCQYLGVSDADISSYLSSGFSNVNWDASTDKLEAIITQKWIATNGITAEQSWFDHTRTGFPLGLPISSLATQTNRPVRLFYPSSEITSNSLNMPKQANAFTDKIFWANN